MNRNPDVLDRLAPLFDPPGRGFEDLLRRREKRQRARKIGAIALATVITATFVGVALRLGNDRNSQPADASKKFGIFAPVAGRIVYVSDGIDLGYQPGLWAADPSGPADTMEGPSVADDVASTLVPLAPQEAIPHGWSSDGTELLFSRSNGCCDSVFYVLHADGSETRLNVEPMYNADAAISPDGSDVAIVAAGPNGTDGLEIVDAESGQRVRLPYSADGEPVRAPTFSPDGKQIAYLGSNGVWVINADGTDAHEIFANKTTRDAWEWFSGMQWSPAGDRIAIGLGGDPAIYTFAPDGSEFRKVITGGTSPYWSPDGSQIAYTIPCDEQPNDRCPAGSPGRALFDPQPGGSPAGLAIADADGSNVRAFGFAASGPWHPGQVGEPLGDEATPLSAPSP